ncbi:PTS sugar transporter subunit IIA [bacterium]|nr:PTS sugar transporter subunit IIA [bacterium]
MQLTVRDVASLLDVAEKQIYDWIQFKDFPAHRVNDQYHFNRAEVLDWVAQRKVASSTTRIGRNARVYHELEKPGAAALTLGGALEAGGVHHQVAGTDKASTLKRVVELMPLPDERVRSALLEILLARERAGTTAVGEGIAIPHAQNPVVLALPRPVVSLCFLEKPLDFQAPDGKPVTTLFSILSPTPKVHLRMLSRLSQALRDPDFRKVVSRRGTRDEILAEARRVDRDIIASSRPQAGEVH